MAMKQLAIAAALLGIATPGHAFDPRNEPTTVMLYYAIPLDARSKKESSPWFGMQLNGKRDYQAQKADFDFRQFQFDGAEGGSAAASLLVIGGVAVGAALLVGHRGKTSQQQVQQEQQQQAATQAPKQPPVPCPTDCPK